MVAWSENSPSALAMDERPLASRSSPTAEASAALRGPDTIESLRRIPLMTLAEALQDRRMLVVIVGWTALNVLLAQGAGAFIEAAGVAWEAHLGGFYAGLLLYGFFDRPPPPLAEPQGFVRDDAAGAE